MSDVQTVPRDSESVAGATMADDETNGSETETIESGRQRKRRGPPDQIGIARSLQSIAPIGTVIPYSQLNPDQRRAVLPTNRMKWLNAELIEHTYNEEMGTLESIRLIPAAWEKNKWQLDPTPSEVNRRTLLTDPKYKIMKMQSENPRREGTHAWYNWEHCYHNDMSVSEYLRFMDYPRDIIVTSNRGKAWFNGPSSVLLNQDVAGGYIGIYDSSLSSDHESYWQKPETFGVAGVIEDDEEIVESVESESDQQAAESETVAG